MPKKTIKAEILFWCFIGFLILMVSCKNENNSKDLAENFEAHAIIHKSFDAKELPKDFKAFWYAGEAEISTYKLEQARYGEIHEGKAVLIYVTEDFLPDSQVKAENPNNQTISVLKLNATKTFNTGMYPYSIMQSTFYPVSNKDHAIKVSSSIQEWCGHVYTQLNNREQFEISSHSYFEDEADEEFSLEKAVLENELWIQLRINPKSLPIGDLEIVPSFEYSRLRHLPLKAYAASTSMTDNIYIISYPELNRTLKITFNPNFPHDILEWEEAFKSGFGPNSKLLTTKATKLKTIKSAYWTKNRNTDEILRDSLQLN